MSLSKQQTNTLIHWMCAQMLTQYTYVKPGLQEQLEEKMGGWIASALQHQNTWDVWYEKTFPLLQKKPEKLWDDLIGMGLILQVNPDLIKNAGPTVRSDPIIMLSLAKSMQWFSCIDATLSKDELFMRQAVVISPHNYRCADSKLQNDVDFSYFALEQYGAQKDTISPVGSMMKRQFLANFPAHVRSDSKIALKALEQDGLALGLLSENQRNDKQYVSLALAQNPYALEYANARMRSDPKIVFDLLRKEPAVYAHVEGRLKRNKKLAIWVAHHCNDVPGAKRVLKNLYQKWYSEVLVMAPLMRQVGAEGLEYLSDKILKGLPWTKNTLRYGHSLTAAQKQQVLDHVQMVYHRKIASQTQRKLHDQIPKQSTPSVQGSQEQNTPKQVAAVPIKRKFL